jgi:ribosomal protein L12E/L44/L45/RPP1/RPP2
MKIVRSLLVACMSLGVATTVSAGCAERPGKKKEDKDAKKDEKKDGEKKDEKKDEKKAD